MNEDEIQARIDAAVKAERERCAAIVRKHYNVVDVEVRKYAARDVGITSAFGVGACHLGMARQEIERGDAP